MLGNIMQLILNNNDFEKACLVMDKLDKGHHTILGVPKIEAMSSFVDHCITEKSPTRAIVCFIFIVFALFIDLIAFFRTVFNIVQIADTQRLTI